MNRLYAELRVRAENQIHAKLILIVYYVAERLQIKNVINL